MPATISGLQSGEGGGWLHGGSEHPSGIFNVEHSNQGVGHGQTQVSAHQCRCRNYTANLM